MSFLMPKVSIPAPPKLEMPDDSKVPNLEDEARRQQEAEDICNSEFNLKVTDYKKIIFVEDKIINFIG